MSFALKYFDPPERWFETWTAVGPAFTNKPAKAARFDTEQDAMNSPAFTFVMAPVDVVPHPYPNRAKEIEEAEPHALHWEEQAAKEDRWADFLESGKVTHHNGLVESPGGYRARAVQYRRVARALRMTAETGEWHCGCTDPPHIVTPEQQGRTPVRYR